MIRSPSAQQAPLMGRREQCTYCLDPRFVRCIYNPIAEAHSFSIHLFVR